MNKDLLLELFKDKLPASLGQPHIIATRQKPYVFCAFYDLKPHELKDGCVIHGTEFRYWRPCSGFGKAKVLAGIVGLDQSTLDIVCCALNDYGTTTKDIGPIAEHVLEMIRDAATDNIGDWTA